MTDRFRLTISQLNPTLGNFKENFSKAVTSWKIGKAEKANLCPYELNKLMLKEAQVVIVPYVYFFEEFIRNICLDGWVLLLTK